MRSTSLLLLLLAAGAGAEDLRLRSVGELLIPTVHFENGYRRHFNERCSATVVAAQDSGPSPWLLTAWHCLEYYRDLSRDITFVHSNGRTSTAVRVASGGGMHADWALLRLAEPMPDPIALVPVEVSLGTTLLMAGFSRNTDGSPSPPLSLDSDCEVIAFIGADVTSNCHARRGASGGAVFGHAVNEGAGDDGAGPYLGIISRGDSDAQSIFVPVQRLAGALSPFLASSPASATAPRARPPRDQW